MQGSIQIASSLWSILGEASKSPTTTRKLTGFPTCFRENDSTVAHVIEGLLDFSDSLEAGIQAEWMAVLPFVVGL